MIKIMKVGEVPANEIFARVMPMANVSDAVADILKNVRERGDEALFEYTERFDKVKLDSFAVTKEEMDEALAKVDLGFMLVLEKAAARLRKFHEHQLRKDFIVDDEPGIKLGQRIIPVDRAGLYVPGGTAAYPSSVLMDVIPAKIAGVREMVMTTPPGRDGKVSPVILAAASVAGVDRIYKLGGAQAIGALAYGTESVPKVDKIVGPGNAFVAEAKKQVYGVVSIDMMAGPSEIMIVSDGKSDPRYVAADLLSQAEHGKDSSAILITDSEELAYAVQAELERQIPQLERAEIMRTSIDNCGKIIVAGDLDSAIDIANEIAPEHLELCVDEPFELMKKVRHAGSVFLGRSCPEPIGDYFAGTNHTLPTCGAAKYASPLSVDDFIKKTQFIYYSEEALRGAAEDVAAFARQEGLTAHANSVLIRLED